jgi:hypothetical protein
MLKFALSESGNQEDADRINRIYKIRRRRDLEKAHGYLAEASRAAQNAGSENLVGL